MPIAFKSPDTGSGGTTVDGQIVNASYETSWSTLRDATNGDANTVITDGNMVGWRSNGSTFFQLKRSIFTFDTSSIPSAEVITSATISIWGTGMEGEVPGGAWDANRPNAVIVSANPASDNNLVAADYSCLGTTLLSNVIWGNIGSNPPEIGWVVGGWNVFTLNATGLTQINKGGITRFGLRDKGHDIDNVTPMTGPSSIFESLSGEYTDGTHKPVATITSGVVYPTDPEVRVTGITRTFWAGIGGNAVYQTQLILGGSQASYISPVSNRNPEPVIPPSTTPSPQPVKGFTIQGGMNNKNQGVIFPGAGIEPIALWGTTTNDFERWLLQTPRDVRIAIFGHEPNYEEWKRRVSH